MRNVCYFSEDRKYRYSLVHRWEPTNQNNLAMWIGLNPSTADENQLDPTLRRIARFSKDWGYSGFVMTNLFAYRATDPRDMKAQADPIGDENDPNLFSWAMVCPVVVAAWGAHGSFKNRSGAIFDIIGKQNLVCLGKNKDGSPKHPLYVAANTKPIPL